MNKYYFTYGTDGQPFVGGWTEVEAPTANLACAAFRAVHPDKEPGILNCSSAAAWRVLTETSVSSAMSVSASRSSHVTRMSRLILKI